MPVLLLVGAGHAHLYVVQHAADLVAAGYQVHLLAPRFFDYSGVASATAAGALPSDTGRIDVRSLSEARGVQFHEDTLAACDLTAQIATTSSGDRLPYNVLSISIGSVVAPTGMQVDPAVLRVKPLSDLADLNARLRELQSRASGRRGATVTVVGAGASGLELAAHLSIRPDVAQIQLVESGRLIGADLPSGARRRIMALLTARGVQIRTGCAVRDLGGRDLVCADGTELSHDVALLAVGLTTPPLLADLGLAPGDGRGVPVRATLQHVDREEIYAVGDCAYFLPRPLPRIGVHGVRQGPVLLQSLFARIRGDSLPVYEPQRRALSILDLGDGVGLSVWGRLWWCGAASLRLKRSIDRRWLRTYQQPGAPAASRSH